MGKQQSTDKLIREKRLRRRKVILFLWGILKSFFCWAKEVITFKKCIVVFCIWYVVKFVEYLKIQNELGNYFSDTVAVAVITAFLVELGLTALSSHRQDNNNDYSTNSDTEYDSNDINFG